MAKSLGVIEVKGIATAFKALDEMAKTSEVKFVGSEKTLGSGLVSIIIRGSTSAVISALEKGRAAADQHNARVAEVMLPNPHAELVGLIEKKWAGEGIPEGGQVSVGSIEIFGFAGFVAAADAALKAADVHLAKYSTAKGQPGTLGLILILRVYGSIENVRAAIDAGVTQAGKVAQVITYSINPRLDKQVFEKFMADSSVK